MRIPDHAQRIIDESSQLNIKLSKLRKLLSDPQPPFINDEQWSLLIEQSVVMTEYSNILDKRIIETKGSNNGNH